MGAENFMDVFRPCCRFGNLKDVLPANSTIALDMSVWIHASLAFDNDEKRTSYVVERMKDAVRVGYNVTAVFDGNPPALKKEVLNKRKDNGPVVTKHLVRKIKLALEGLQNIEMVQASQEANSQLAFIVREGKADAVMTVDTGLLFIRMPCHFP